MVQLLFYLYSIIMWLHDCIVVLVFGSKCSIGCIILGTSMVAHKPLEESIDKLFQVFS